MYYSLVFFQTDHLDQLDMNVQAVFRSDLLLRHKAVALYGAQWQPRIQVLARFHTLLSVLGMHKPQKTFCHLDLYMGWIGEL